MSTTVPYPEVARTGAPQASGIAGDGAAPTVADRSRRGDRHQSQDRLYVLDLLRFGAAMTVVGYHLLAPSNVWGADTAELFTHPARQFFRYGWMGVEFFFIISGFVICMSGWGRSTTNFFISRVTRLMPAYVLGVLLTSAVLAIGPSDRGAPPLSQVAANLTMIQGLLKIPHIDSVYWTLLIELKFYLLFALVVWAGATYRRVVLFCIAWTTAGLFASFAASPLLVAILEPRYTSYFVAGITLYLMYRFGPNLLLWGMLGVSSILCAISLEGRVDQLAGLGERVNITMALPFLAVFFALMIAVALRWFSWLRWPGLVTIGSLTYPVYLLHQQIGHVMIRRFSESGLPAWLLLSCIVLGILLAAHLMHVFFERPVARILRRHLTTSMAQIRANTPLGSATVSARVNQYRPDREVGQVGPPPREAQS